MCLGFRDFAIPENISLEWFGFFLELFGVIFGVSKVQKNWFGMPWARPPSRKAMKMKGLRVFVKMDP